MSLVFRHFIMAAMPHVKCDVGSGRKNRSIQNLFNIDKGTFMDSRESRGKVSEYTLFL